MSCQGFEQDLSELDVIDSNDAFQLSSTDESKNIPFINEETRLDDDLALLENIS